MKKILPLIILANFLTTAAQTEQSDTTSVNELDEVVVEAANQYTTANVTIYIPVSRIKKTATDAISLLDKMAIPELSTSGMPGSTSVTTISGESVSIFIDNVPATTEDLTGMQTMDVKRVEYLVYPKDPRFNGVHYAINFIMQKYEWGGYTKLLGYKWFGSGRNESAQLYSKFAYKSMKFDIYADETYKKSDRTRTDISESYNFVDLFGEGLRKVERESATLSSMTRSNSNNISFRAIYSNQSLQIINKLSINNTLTPRNHAESSLIYSDPLFPNSTYTTHSSGHVQSLKYNLDVYAALSKTIALDVTASYSFSHTTSNYRYDNTDLSIINNASDYGRSFRFAPTLQVRLNRNHYLSPSLMIVYSNDGIAYTGNTPSHQRLIDFGAVENIAYDYNNDNLSAGVSLGMTHLINKISGSEVRSNYIQAHGYFNYSFNNKNKFGFNLSHFKNSPGMSYKSPNMLQKDEFLWYTGDPSLGNVSIYTGSLNYTWLPNNTWQIATFTQIESAIGNFIGFYTPEGPDGTLLRKYSNNENNYLWSTGLNTSAKFLKGNLIASINPTLYYFKNTGEYVASMWSLACNASLTWYFGNWYIQGKYNTPETGLENNGTRVYNPQNYRFTIGWGNGNWRISAIAYKFFNSGWKNGSHNFTSPYYSFNQVNYSTSGHRLFFINISYTFGYGKKVQRGNEVNGIGTAENAILK
ncbi:MAG: hypothetical protein K2K68_03925 [Duncaniella sp.]|nr:hypothetical protein [Duncaniella sp.]